MFRGGSTQFDKLLEKATSNLLLEPDWKLILQICDCIRQGDVQPKYAVNAMKKKFYAPNPHIALFSLQVLESCIKNCGSLIHQEVATKAFMEELRELVKTSPNENVKNKILELIQAWAHAFRNEPNYRAVQDTLNLMKVEGYSFPALKESDAMFIADRAPEWADGDCCHRCRVGFGMVQRKHHCRNCGQIFCAKCSSKTATIPKFGIEKEVRVCEACFEKLTKTPQLKNGETDLPPEYLGSSLSLQPQVPPVKTEQELQEEEEFQLALALSKSEAETKEKEKLRATQELMRGVNSNQLYSPSSSSAPPAMDNSLDVDPELARYLNRSYWEQRQQQEDIKSHVTTVPTAPASSTSSTMSTSPIPKISEKYQNGETDELGEFINALRGNVEIFVNRMKSNSSRGRHIANDTAVQSLFLTITAMHSQLLKNIQEQEDQRVHFESLQDKLSQIKDARAALDALREDHRDKLRREAEEAERIRQIQMAQKLDLMRKKKQEYLEFQRQLALQRMQEQEREMQMRQEQQKQQYLRGMPSAVFSPPPGPYMPNVPNPQNFNANKSTDGSPVHTPFPQHPGHFPGMPPPPTTQPSFQPYNMQSMVNTLPSLGQVPYNQQMMPPVSLTQPHPALAQGGPSSLPPMPSGQPMQMQAGSMPSMPPHNIPPHPNQPMMVQGPPMAVPHPPGPMDQQQPSQQQRVIYQQPAEAELISFD